MASSTVSDEEVQAEVREVERLRAELASAEAQRLERERGQANAIQLAQLRAEKERLTLEVGRAKEAAKASAVEDGVAAPLVAARSNMEAAVAAQKEDAKLAKADGKNSTAASATNTGEGS